MSASRIAALAGAYALGDGSGRAGISIYRRRRALRDVPLAALAARCGLVRGPWRGRIVHRGHDRHASRCWRWRGCALVLIASSGAIGAYQAGVEWKFLPGPASCTGARFAFHGGG